MESNVYGDGGAGAFGGMFVMFFWLAVYAYYAVAQMKIAQKLGHPNPWFAWIPLLNMVQIIQMAQKPLWWFLLMFVPIVNIICIAALWMNVARRTGYSAIVGLLTLVPIVQFITLGMMAFGGGSTGGRPGAPADRPRQPAGVA